MKGSAECKAYGIGSYAHKAGPTKKYLTKSMMSVAGVVKKTADWGDVNAIIQPRDTDIPKWGKT